MKKIFYSIIILVLGTVLSGVAQQRAQYTQYMINPFLTNPAVSGTEEYADFRLGYRKQWAGFEGSPRSIFLSGHTSLGRHHVVNSRSRHKKNGFHGVGGVVQNDVIGPTSTLNINAAYSYHMEMAKNVFGSLGIMGGLQQYTLDGSQLKTYTPDDPRINSVTGKSLADINIGGWLYSEHFFVGASMINVVPQKLYTESQGLKSAGKMAHHYLIMGGYRFKFAYDYTFIPSVCVKAVSPAPISYDINAKVRYKDLVWGGLSYRNKDAVALLVGVIVNNLFDISYSYDITTSNIGNFSSGSHEVIVGYRLQAKGRVICPSGYW